MMKSNPTIELLAPAGNFEALIAAVQNGANAVYLGGNQFNARKNAINFTDQELKKAVKYAHLRDVKIYVTLNTLYYDYEFDDLRNYIDFLYKIQVDALIIQDIGLFKLVSTLYPNFELHASTQTTITNLNSVLFLKEFGVKRVVLARENTIKEIKEIIENTDIEIEVFVHGALCLAYSGQCLMSSMIGKRSGNRGNCAQPCRLKYQLYKDEQIYKNNKLYFEKKLVSDVKNNSYLLSTKDLNTLDNIGELIEAGVKSFKIEGRMKRAEYVAATVKAYRKAIDRYYLEKSVTISKADQLELSQTFNRQFTKGYLFENDIVDAQISGNRGVVIGKVLDYSFNRKKATIKLFNDLQQYDGIRFEHQEKGFKLHKIYQQGLLINEAKAGDVILIDCQDKINKDELVYRLFSVKLNKELADTFNKENKKIDISLAIVARIGELLRIEVSDFTNEVIVTDEYLVEEATQSPLQKERLIEQLSKLNQTPFKIKEINIDMDDNVFLSIKVVNQLRRKVIEQLITLREHKIINSFKPVDLTKSIVIDNTLTKEKSENQNKIKKVMVQTNNLKQLKVALRYKIDTILFPYNKETAEALKLTHEAGVEFVLALPNIINQELVTKIKNDLLYPKINRIMLSDYGSLIAFKDKDCLLNNNFNLLNKYSINYFKNNDIVTSFELSKKEIKDLLNISNKLILPVYGRINLMTTKHCPISYNCFGYKKDGCRLCKEHQYYLKDRKDEQYPLITDEECRINILHHKPLYLTQFKDLNIKGILINFTIETKEEIESVMDNYIQYLYSNEKIKNDNNTSHFKGYYVK